jgi:hypothetical protein
MKSYIRYPAYTVVQGLSRTGGLLAVLNIVGIICLFAHQHMFERRLKELDNRFLVEQQEALEKQLESVQEQEAIANSQSEAEVKPNHIQSSLSMIDTMVPAKGETPAPAGFGQKQVQEPTLEDLEEFKENAHNQRETLLPSLDFPRAKTNDARDNRFRSMYSFQTFKWMILQT